MGCGLDVTFPHADVAVTRAFAGARRASTSRTWFITGASRGFGTLFVKEALERGDTVAAIAQKNAFVAGELAQWRELAVSTDFSR